MTNHNHKYSFFDSPYAAVVALDKLCHEIGCSELDYNDMVDRLWEKLIDYLIGPPDDKCDRQIWLQTDRIHKIITDDFIESRVPGEPFLWIPEEFKPGNVQPDTICRYMAWWDFCVSELNYNCNSEVWQTFQAIVNNCGWIASYQELCVVCDLLAAALRYRPSILTFDEQHKLHGEDKPAIQFVDGYSVYASHGNRISKFE